VTSAYLITPSQDFSLIVTGGMLSFFSHDASVPITVAYNPLNCSDEERYVVLTALDHGGDGWGTGNSFELRDTFDNSLVMSGTLTNEDGQQFRKRIPLCLPAGTTYSVSLIQGGLNTDEMGLEVSPCNAYLSKYLSSSTFSITSAASSYCGDCGSQFKLQVSLLGSFYGIPYGWNKNTHYSVWNSVNGNSYQGTLVTGMYGLHYYCLSSGTWLVEFSDVPTTDDGEITDDYMAKHFGVEEYEMIVSTSTVDKTITPGMRATVSVSGTSASISVGNAGPTSSPTLATPSHVPTLRPTSVGPIPLPTIIGPTRQPTPKPSTIAPTTSTSARPTSPPTRQPSNQPTRPPSNQPTRPPSITPTKQPTRPPSITPTKQPTRPPSNQPTRPPSITPTKQPTRPPSITPTKQPTRPPSIIPTKQPTRPPSNQPTRPPSIIPTKQPTRPPSITPTKQPTRPPSNQPTRPPSITPTKQPTRPPSIIPTKQPTPSPSGLPTVLLTSQPSKSKTTNPKNPTVRPTFSSGGGLASFPSIQPPGGKAPKTPKDRKMSNWFKKNFPLH
jgi:hypothetical protein